MLVPDHFRKCVGFIGIKKNGRFLPKATCFFATINEDGLRFSHIITAEHVISGLLTKGHEIWLRTNAMEGGVSELAFPADAWRFHPENEPQPTDVATTTVTVTSNDDTLGVPLVGANACPATTEAIAAHYIGAGDEVAIIGLFKNHYGKQRNIPIIRIGNIASLSEEPIFTRYCGYTEAHLIEARSINGLSGSPVFVSMPPSRVVNSLVVNSDGFQFYLLGLMHGHFEVKDMIEDIVAEDVVGASVGINTGIGVVIPVEKILETILQDDFSTQRKAISELKRRNESAINENTFDF